MVGHTHEHGSFSPFTLTKQRWYILTQNRYRKRCRLRWLEDQKMENDGVESGVGEIVISISDDDHITSVGGSTLRTSGTDDDDHVIRRQGWKKVTAYHAVYLAFNAILIGYNNIRYQNPKPSSFETHPLAMTTSVIAFCIYGSAAGLQYMLLDNYEQYEKYSTILYHVIIFSGIITAVSNVLVFLPNGISWIVLVLFELCATLVLAYDFFWFIYNKINATTSSVPAEEMTASGINQESNNNNATTPESTGEINQEINNNPVEMTGIIITDLGT